MTKRFSDAMFCFMVFLFIFLSAAVCSCQTYGDRNSHTSSSTAENPIDFAEFAAFEEVFLNTYFYGSDPAVYDSSDITSEVLENRDGNLIIERVIGRVTDRETGEGKILNPGEFWDGHGTYINYSCFGHELDEGTVLVSYLVYDPDTNGIDDITDRWDFVLKEGFSE